MLASVYTHSIDSKTRLAIPAKYRDELGDKFFITKSPRDKCLIVYSKEGWDEYVAPLEKMTRSEKEAVTRFLHKNGVQAEPDAQGRVLLGDNLVKHAQIVKNAVIIGCGKYAEIWAEEIYNETEENIDDIIGILEKYGL